MPSSALVTHSDWTTFIPEPSTPTSTKFLQLYWEPLSIPIHPHLGDRTPLTSCHQEPIAVFRWPSYKCSGGQIPGRPAGRWGFSQYTTKCVNSTCADQVAEGVRHVCTCDKPCCHKFIESYTSKDEYEEALLSLRQERTAGTSSDETIWLFNHLHSSRRKHRGNYEVIFVLDDVQVCEEYYTVVLGFNYPNRHIQKYVRMIQVYCCIVCYVLCTHSLIVCLHCRLTTRICHLGEVRCITVLPFGILQWGRG